MAVSVPGPGVPPAAGPVRPRAKGFRRRSPGLAWRLDQQRRRSYLRSNAEWTVPLAITAEIVDGARRLREALAQEDEEETGRVSQRIVDQLCDGTGIPRIPVNVKGPRLVRGRVEFYGFCGRNGTITLYCRTARRNRMVAFKTYLNTLVHEFMHHDDWTRLRIHSMHTGGFYRRIGFVYKGILGALDGLV